METGSLASLKSVFAPYRQWLATRRGLADYRCKIRLELQKGHFTVRTAGSWAELEEVLRLRHEVFHQEILGRRLPARLDIDRHDGFADHLMVVDEREGKVVGTYRLLLSRFTPSFYSQSEFELEGFLALPGEKLELSRACIHPDYRDGLTLHLLWRGLMRYAQLAQADILFGCASVHTMDRGEIALLYKYLSDRGLTDESTPVMPRPEFEVEALDAEVDRWERIARYSSLDNAKALLPPLLWGYLRAGAKVFGRPALDRDFQCVDFLTVLHLRQMSRQYERKYAAC